MAWLWIYSGFSALFLAKVHHLGMESIGLAMSASGIGGFLGMVIMGKLSDGMGRKAAIMLSGLLCCCSGLAIIAMPVGTGVGGFAIFFFFWGMFGGAFFPLYLGTLAAESRAARVCGNGRRCAHGCRRRLSARPSCRRLPAPLPIGSVSTPLCGWRRSPGWSSWWSPFSTWRRRRGRSRG